MLKILQNNTRVVFGLVFLCASCSYCFGLILQYFFGLEPCVMCMLQRVALFGVALFSLLAWLLPNRISQAINLILIIASSVGGLYIAIKQTWLQWYPLEYASCGRDFYGLWQTLPFGAFLERALSGSADCATVDWTLFGLTLANYGVLFFGAVLIVSILLVLAKLKSKSLIA